MNKNQKDNTVTMSIDEYKKLVETSDKQSDVLLVIVSALKQHPTLFPRLADTEDNAPFYDLLHSATDDLLNSDFSDLLLAKTTQH